ncbi:cytochrome b/b6 domain-containing protein [Streptomyces sp. CC224B]|uniref:cytochrome b/b6 domain-containing protein n=1 Tax=Streptomyces sp. CC224B TaxID=3044571 RepID=UPI0024A902E4|nr:cytochrome b/b6 domain-containing protein [Streptomyces sp. CC224B]
MSRLHPHHPTPQTPVAPGSSSLRSPTGSFADLFDGSSAGPGRAARGLVSAACLLLIPLLVFAGDDDFRAALDHTTGVLSLVALTASVAWGLVASDRLFLRPRQRLLAQAVHRATAIASVGFLLLHGTVKLALDHVSLLGALVPFGLGFTGAAGLIGLGSLAGLLMVATGVTGALRSAFAAPVQVAGRWRAVHMLAYPAWCAALLHGLYAGRPPKPWVVALYCLCLVAVAGAVALRAAPRPVKREVAARVLAVLEPDGRGAPSAARRHASGPARDTASTPLPGTVPPPRGAPSEPVPVAGIAAAYRALATPSDRHTPGPPPDLTATEVLPTATPPWPTPSPPPPAEAPDIPFPYDSTALHDEQHDYGDTRYGYGDPRYDHRATPCGTAAPFPGAEVPYDTGARPVCPPPPHEPPYVPPYDPVHGPGHTAEHAPAHGSVGEPPRTHVHDGDSTATQPLPTPFQAPSGGEPWNAASTGGST